MLLARPKMRDATHPLPPLVIPDDVINDGLAFSNMADAGRFGMGDEANEYIAEMRRYYPVGEILLALADAWGVSYDQLRDYCRLSRAIDEHTRGVLPLGYSQFRACLGAGAEWRTVAEWALASGDEYGGRPAPVRVIEAHIREQSGRDGLPWSAHIDRALGTLEWYAAELPAEGWAKLQPFLEWWEGQG